MMEAYFDESGTHNKSLLVIAGFVSDADKWRAFEAHAEAIKRDFNIEYFHSKKKRNKHSSLYKHLSPSQRDDMEAALSKAVCECASHCVISTIIPHEYESLTTPKFRSQHGSAFGVCVGGVIFALSEILGANEPPRNGVSIFLEDGHVNVAEGIEIIKGYKKETEPPDSEFTPVYMEGFTYPKRGSGLQVGLYGLGDKRTMSPLWAADLAAYNVHGAIIKKNNACLSVMESLYSRVNVVGVDWHGSAIRALVDVGESVDPTSKAWRLAMHGVVKECLSEGMRPAKNKHGILFNLARPEGE